MSATAERRKHWGWGSESRQPSAADLEAMAPLVRERLGFDAQPVEEPVPLKAIDLPAPRITPSRALEPICAADPHSRATHALGKATRDVWRGLRGRFEHPPDLVARPRDEHEVEAVLEWCVEQGYAAIPYGGGTSVVGGIEPRLPREYPGVVSIDLGRARPGVRGRRGLACGQDPGRGVGPGAGGPAPRARAHAALLPAVLRVLDAWRLDRDPRRRPLRHQAHAHRRHGRVGARDHAGGRMGVAPPAGLRRRAEPGPDADRLRGDPWESSPRRGYGSSPGRPTRPRVPSPSNRSRPAPKPCASWRSPGSTRRTAGCSMPRRRASTVPATATSAMLMLGFESAHHRGRFGPGCGARSSARPRRRGGSGADRRRWRRERSVRRMARCVHARRRTCATR